MRLHNLVKQSKKLSKVFRRSSCDHPKSLLAWGRTQQKHLHISRSPKFTARSSIKPFWINHSFGSLACKNTRKINCQPIQPLLHILPLDCVEALLAASDSSCTWVGRAPALARPKKQWPAYDLASGDILCTAKPLTVDIELPLLSRNVMEHPRTILYHLLNPILLNGFPFRKTWFFLVGFARNFWASNKSHPSART